jgi:hypothetical protein
MVLFKGRYSWDGTKKDGREPIAWFPGAYDLKIFDRTADEGGVTQLKPYICVYSKTGEGQSISVNPEKFAKQICHEFSLDIEKVLWVEDLLTEKDRYNIVMFNRSGRLSDTVFYKTVKRKPFAAEVRQIEAELAEAETS